MTAPKHTPGPQLLPCPFCGGEAGLMECDDVEIKRRWLFKWAKYPADGAFVTGRLVRPICRVCHVTTCAKFTEDEFAAEFWNSRKPVLAAATGRAP